MLRARWFWIPAAVTTAVAAVLCFVPLFDVLGYELALGVGIVAAVTGAVIGLGAGRAADDPLGALGRGVGLALLQLVPALALASLNALRVKNCDYLEGLWFFLLLPVPTAAYAASLGVVVARLLRGGTRRARVAALVAVLVAPLAATLWMLYYEPPIFAFDHLWGFFAGSLYDEVIPIDARLLVFRLGTVLRVTAIVVVLAMARRARRRGAVVVAVLGAIAACAGYDAVLGPRAGYLVTRADLRAALPDTVERPGIVVHLPPGLDDELRRAIADDHEYRLLELEATLGVGSLPVIHSYVYASAAQKARLMGGRGTMVAKPWLFEIHVHGAMAPHPVVAHELAHVVAAAFAPPPLRVSTRWGLLVNMGLVEGLAEAVTPPSGAFDLDTWARALRQLGLAPDMRAILGPAGFWTAAPRRAYTIAGSFVRYLLRSYGTGPLQRAYAHGDFEVAYGRDLGSLVAEWERHIDALPLTPRELAAAQEQFRTPSIFARVCAHEVSSLRAAAAEAPPSRAVELYRRIAGFVGETPGSRFDVAMALERAGDSLGFAELAAQLLAGHSLTSAERTTLLGTEGMDAWERGELDVARARFVAATAASTSASSDRLQWVRLWALDLPPELRAGIREFLSGDAPSVASVLALDAVHRKLPADETAPYLIARQLQQAGACEQALPYLAAAAPHPFPEIEAERLRLTAVCQERLGRLSEAAETHRRYAALAPSSGEVARAIDAADRCEWRAGSAERMEPR